ncbi:MAG: hypothetical protein JRI56_07370 [Deltaproteobacteria bacterium]|nr:hypothetical protein [Deltaproteobacteria bacterium]
MAMKKCILKDFLFVLIVVLLASDNYAAEKTALKLNLKPGQKYKRVITMEENISQSMAGEQMDIAHTKKVGLEFEVKDVDANGIASVKVTYRTLKEKTSSTAGEFEYNPENPTTLAESPLAPTYTAMMGESFVMKVAGNGRIVELTGFDEMFSLIAEKIVVAEDEMISKLPPSKCDKKKDGPAACEKPTKESQEELAKRRIDGMNKKYGSREGRVKVVKEMLEKNPSVAKEQVRLMLACVMTPFPDEPVQTGDSWTDKMDLKAMMLPVEIESVYTLKEDKGDTAIVSGSFESKMKDPAIDYGAGPMQGKMKMEGSCQRSSQIDKSSGWVIRSNARLNISGKIKMPGNAQMPQGMEVPITVESTVTVEPTESIATH